MNLTVEYQPITELFRNAHTEGRHFLYEFEVYNLLSLSGSETPPKCSFIPRNAKPMEEEIMSLPGEKAVLKIISPTIVHKTEVGGVRIVPKTPDKVRSAVRRMLSEVPERYAEWIERCPASAPESYKGLAGTALQNAIAADLKGVLQVQFMPPDSASFGNELIVGLRRTREFGMVISAGLGGTDTELYAERFRKGQAIVAALTELTDGDAFFELFRKTVSYRKLAGLTRGQRRIVTDDQLIECFESFIRMGNYFSPCNPDAPFIIEELEINPFTFTDYLMVPLDGMCRFSTPGERPAPRPIQKIANLLHPKSIGIIGVSLKTSSTPVLTATNSSSSVTAKTTPAGCAACRTSVRFLIRWICSSSPSERNRFRLWWMKSLKTTPRTASCSSPAASVKRKKAGK